MKNNKGVASILIVLIIVGVLALGGGTYYFLVKKAPKPVVCTQEAKICPDGSTVSRIGPDCEFAECSSKEEAIINFGKWDNKSLNDFIENSKKDKNNGDRIKYITQGFIGVPHQGNTLVGAKNIPEKFIINLGGVDCSTLSDYVLALVFANDIKDFSEKLRLIRYELGKIDFANRNHFFSQWVKNNSNYLSDISDNFTGSVCETKELNKKKEGDYWVDGIEPFIQKICYVPRNIILDKSFESKLKNGDIVGFHTSSIGLDVTHEGIISINNNEVYLIHPSSKYNKVIEEKLSEYLKMNPWSDGLIIVRS